MIDNEFKKAFERFKFLKITDMVKLFGICSFQLFKKGELIAKEGEVCKNAFLIRKGIIRTFILTTEGDQRTIKIAKEGEFTSTGESFLFGNPSKEYLEVIMMILSLVD